MIIFIIVPRHALTPCQRLMNFEYCRLITTSVSLHMYKLEHTSWKWTQLYSFYIFYIIGNILCLTIFRLRRCKYIYCMYYPEDPLSAGSLLTWRQYNTWREVWNRYINAWLCVSNFAFEFSEAMGYKFSKFRT